jgi:xanthine dehydrogenase molybdopterin-binding subunit B
MHSLREICSTASFPRLKNSHAGFQGIHTKVVQTVAKTLKIPMELISVKPTNSFVSPNTSATWGSTGTDCTCSVSAHKARLSRFEMDLYARGQCYNLKIYFFAQKG